MIIEYHRPNSIDETISLLSRKDPKTVILGGGLYLNEKVKDQIAVVDIQNLGLDTIETKGKIHILGAGVRLQQLVEMEGLPTALISSIKHQETYNRRQVATLAGTFITADGRSPVTCVLLALDAELAMVGNNNHLESILLGDFLPVRKYQLVGKLFTKITIPSITKTVYNYVARSPADRPIVAAAVSLWPSGRTRVVLSGYGDQPVMVLDGTDAEGADAAARDAYSQADDQWAKAEYRSDTAAVLVRRSLNQIAEIN
ncbi:MAG: FAD binding domain-containing protein [Anaerolineales bacterium]|nr:FAD binding domain-containing protein [Anaerolineales bacterium]